MFLITKLSSRSITGRYDPFVWWQGLLKWTPKRCTCGQSKNQPFCDGTVCMDCWHVIWMKHSCTIDSIVADPSSLKRSQWMKPRTTFYVAASIRIILKVVHVWSQVMIPLFKHVGNVGFCDGTHRKEEGIRKYNEFLLKANNKLKEENETLKVTTKRYLAAVGIMLIDSSSIDKGAVGCKQTKHAVCCFSNSNCDRYRSCNQTDTSLKYLPLSLSLVKCILNPTRQ